MDEQLIYTRKLLAEWAEWLERGGGYASQASIEWFRQGGCGSGIFGSTVPKDVEPSYRVAKASQAMQHLRVLDGDAAGIIAEIYQKKRRVTFAMLARQRGVAVPIYQTIRKKAERKFSGLYQQIFDSDSRINRS